MGYSHELITSEYQPGFLCIVCQQVSVDPLTCRECGDVTICKECSASSSGVNFCPSDDKETQFAVHRLVEGMINSLNEKCKNQECSVQMKLRDIVTHIKDECPYTEEDCPECGEKIKRKETEEHLQNYCLAVLFPCKNQGCEEAFNRTEIEDHQENKCVHKLLPCPNAGCGDLVKRNAKDNHVQNVCLFEMYACANEGCLDQYNRRQIDDHVSQHCGHRLVQCQNDGCSQMCKAQNIGNHKNADCLYQSIKCANGECPEYYLRKNYISHQEACNYIRIDCECGEKYLGKDRKQHICIAVLLRKQASMSQQLEYTIAQMKNQETIVQNLVAENTDLKNTVNKQEIEIVELKDRLQESLTMKEIKELLVETEEEIKKEKKRKREDEMKRQIAEFEEGLDQQESQKQAVSAQLSNCENNIKRIERGIKEYPDKIRLFYQQKDFCQYCLNNPHQNVWGSEEKCRQQKAEYEREEQEYMQNHQTSQGELQELKVQERQLKEQLQIREQAIHEFNERLQQPRHAHYQGQL